METKPPKKKRITKKIELELKKSAAGPFLFWLFDLFGGMVPADGNPEPPVMVFFSIARW